MPQLDVSLPWRNMMEPASSSNDMFSMPLAANEGNAQLRSSSSDDTLAAGTAQIHDLSRPARATVLRRPRNPRDVTTESPRHKLLELLERGVDDAATSIASLPRRRYCADFITVFASPEVEEEFWRFALWVNRWETVIIALVFSIIGTTYGVLNNAAAVEWGITAPSVLLLVACFAMAMAAHCGRSSPPETQRRLVALFFRYVPIAMCVAIFVGLIYTLTTSTSWDCPSCARHFPFDYCVILFLCAVVIRNPLLVFAVLTTAHASAVLSLSLWSGRSSLDVALFGAYGFFMALYVVLYGLMWADRVRNEFETHVGLMLTMWHTEEQATALVDIANVALPPRVAARLQRDSIATARGELRKAVQQSKENVYVIAVAMVRLTGHPAGHVTAMARCTSALCEPLDAAARQTNIDTAGLVGDTYLCTSGLHESEPSVTDVRRFLTRLPRIAATVMLNRKLSSLTRPENLLVELAAAVALGPATADFAGARFIVTGTATSDALREVKRCRPSFCAAPVEVLRPFLASSDSSDESLSAMPPEPASPFVVVPFSDFDKNTTDLFDTSNPLEVASAVSAQDGATTVASSQQHASHDRAVKLAGTDPRSFPELDRAKMTAFGTFVDADVEADFQEVCASVGSVRCQRVAVLLGVVKISVIACVIAEQAATKVSGAVTFSLVLLSVGVGLVVDICAFIVGRVSKRVPTWTFAPAAAFSVCTLYPLVFALTGTFFANLPALFAPMLVVPLASLLRHHSWVMVFMFCNVFLLPFIGASEAVAIEGTGGIIAIGVAIVLMNGLFSRDAGINLRRHFADTTAIKRGTTKLFHNGALLVEAATTSFPRPAVKKALGAFFGDYGDGYLEPADDEHFDDLLLCRVALSDQTKAGSYTRFFEVVAAELASRSHLALIHAAGDTVIVAGGFAKSDFDMACAAGEMISFAQSLRSKMDSLGVCFNAAVDVEEAQGVLAGTRASLRYHLVGRVMVAVAALLDAVEPPSASSYSSLTLAISSDISTTSRSTCRSSIATAASNAKMGSGVIVSDRFMRYFRRALPPSLLHLRATTFRTTLLGCWRGYYLLAPPPPLQRTSVTSQPMLTTPTTHGHPTSDVSLSTSFR